MVSEAVLVGIIVTATAVVFAMCCRQIVRASFSERSSRAETRLALYWGIAFAVALIGCLAFSDARGNDAAAVFSAVFCLASLGAGCALGRSWRRGERDELERVAELLELVDRYREAGASVESRCARAAREHDLTRREEEVLALLLEGRTRSEIARELYVSGDTVKTHIRNLYRKMDVSGKDELVETMVPDADTRGAKA